LYWIQKYIDPSFHPQTHGGKRHEKFDNITRNMIRIALWDILERFPLGTIPFFQEKLRELNFDVSYDDIRTVFESWNWSWKIPTMIQLQKFTSENLEYYFNFAIGVRDISLIKMKWLDEAHFMPSRLLKGHRVWNSKSERAIIVDKSNSLSISFSATALLSLDESHPVILDFREDTNTQFDFLRFVLYILENDYLKDGDYFFMDSARIHGADATWEIFFGLLQAKKCTSDLDS